MGCIVKPPPHSPLKAIARRTPLHGDASLQSYGRKIVRFEIGWRKELQEKRKIATGATGRLSQKATV
jgi:hypothetical protein